MKNKKGLFKNVISLLLVVILAFSLPVTSLASGGFIISAEESAISPETTEKAKEIAKQIEAEGIVLLENEDDVLPLKNKKVNVFGSASCSLAFAGAAGSGAVRASQAVGFYDALTNAGIEYNKALYDIYADYTDAESDGGLIDYVGTVLEQFFSGGQSEMPIRDISDSVMSQAAAYSDTAVVVIGRVGTEMKDLSVEDLKLTEEEKAMLDKVCGVFSDVIVVLNISNIMDMSWLDDYDSIKAALIMWLPGEVATDSVGRVLSGEINPSGKLADTIAYNLEDHPSNMNFGSYTYKGVFGIPKYFVNYNEGIYVGYRYFETFAPEKVMYPFGYGLSYTDFDWDVKSYKADEKEISVEVEVKNIGTVPGKEVVEVYFSAPYYMGGIEKSAIELAGYDKTKLLAPGESEVLTIKFATEDMASYDSKTEQAWVLDKGEYKIHVARDIRTFEESFTYNVAETVVYKTDSYSGAEIKNLFGFAEGDLTYMSRADVEDTYPTAPTNYQATEEVKNSDKRPAPTKEGVAPKTGVVYDDGPIMLSDVAKDDSLWDAFLDQLTVDEMIELISDCGYETAGLDRLGIPSTSDNDGPSCIKGSGGLLYMDSGLAYPVATVIACTWNDELAEDFGEIVGQEGVELGTHVWYAPGCNIHRSPLGGRNNEYFSEDPLLSGKMSAAVTRGVQSKGIIVTVKHFVANDQETNRQSNGLYTWLNEQSLREIYAEPFEISFKEGGAKGIMTAYNRIGNQWCGGSKALVTDLLRTEWGFDGFVITDASIDLTGGGYLDPALAVYARNDAILTMLYVISAVQTRNALKETYKADPIGMGNAMRLCVYDICRMKIESNAFTPEGDLAVPENPSDSTVDDDNAVVTFIKDIVNKAVSAFSGIFDKIKGLF
ncbi:MAG: glycoside hydrolase family 3 C-terminal domain-containing protein [Clostridia bacterium]|nr:glycoside hydrolase family 3 C-terminal domain-containing protein [Clostridia bacterium]